MRLSLTTGRGAFGIEYWDRAPWIFGAFGAWIRVAHFALCLGIFWLLWERQHLDTGHRHCGGLDWLEQGEVILLVIGFMGILKAYLDSYLRVSVKRTACTSIIKQS
jgi:hypothetical protein